MPEMLQINDENLDTLLKSDKPAVLAVGASWCADCRRAAPFFATFAKPLAGKVLFAYADFDSAKGVIARLGIDHIPTMIAFKGGKETERLTEVTAPSVLKEFLERSAT
jgi:thioredoxin 1